MEKNYYEAQQFENLELIGETFENHKYVDCEFTNCTFDDCKLIRCSFSECTFYKCKVTNLNKIEYSKMQDTEFIECYLVGVHWSELLPSGRFAEPIKKMQRCRLKYNTFTDMNLNKVDFSGTDILESIFSECQLVESDFKNCKLKRSEFFKCDIRKADFREATGYQIDILSSKMNEAKFSFPEVVNLLDVLGIIIE